MAQFHFIEDYEKYVRWLMRRYPIDTAMSIAVGGDFDKIGAVERDILLYAGLTEQKSLVDFGCGSGRLAIALPRDLEIEYLGLDVVEALLKYAAGRCPKKYQFQLNRTLSIPVPDESVDMVCAFSVFTHLLITETYIYIEDILRCLRPGGRLVLSFLELSAPNSWHVFSETVQQQREKFVPVLNSFLERSQIEIFTRHLRHGHAIFHPPIFINADAAPWPSHEPLGQTVAILIKS